MRSGIVAGVVAALMAVGGVHGVRAGDLAAVITNTDNPNYPSRELRGLNPATIVSVLEQNGFEVIEGRNLDRAGFRRLAAELSQKTAEMAESDRFFIFFAGHSVRRSDGIWLVPAETRLGNDRAVAFSGIPGSALSRILADQPGRAALFIGQAAVVPDELAAVSDPEAQLTMPQGVLLVEAPAGRLDDVASALLRNPGEVPRNAQLSGFVAPGITFGNASEPRPEPVADPLELVLWARASLSQSEADYRAYLERFPEGVYADEARARLDAADPAPVITPEERVEIDLGLTANDRRQVQRDLQALGHDPRGVDGVFGPGTRSAIRSWQTANDFTASGYLTGRQMTRLANRAEATRERERRRRDEADAAFWRTTGQNGSESGLRAYLSRYPRGIYADQARAQLEEIERRRPAPDTESDDTDIRAFRAARRTDTVRAYRDYLEAYPEGARVGAARKRITELRNEARHRKVENDMNLSPATKLLVEQRLAVFFHQPGPVDGIFDENTRNAIRSYQTARGREVTGYLSPQSLLDLAIVARR